ncbi:MAG: ribonuclease D [Myxococcales bacterium]|nr:ribonuclease D [Myxococcales bacterium]
MTETDYTLCNTPAAVAAAVAAIEGADTVAFDTEFHSERTYVPRLMLLQVATAAGIWLVDPIAGIDLGPLYAALTGPGRRVVGHALKNDLRIVWMLTGRTPPRAWDTQTAAAFLGHGLQIGLSTLLHSVLGVHQPKGDQMADWSQRPLPDRMLGYAAGDVRNLLELYRLQRAELMRRDRLAWVEEECAELTEPTRYVRDPDNAFLKLQGGRRLDAREAGVLRALAEEREALAQEQDLVPHFLIPDEVVHLLARHAPRARKDLDGDRRMQHRAVHRHADRWLAAIARGLAAPHHREPGRSPPPPELEAVAALVMLGVQDLAYRLDIAPQLLSKRDILVQALREAPRTRDALADAAQLRGWRRDVLGATLWDLVDGRLHAVCRPGGPAGVRVAFESPAA